MILIKITQQKQLKSTYGGMFSKLEGFASSNRPKEPRKLDDYDDLSDEDYDLAKPGASPLAPVDHQKGLKRAFFDISIDGIGKGRILMELFDDTVPKTVNNLCGNQLQAPFNLGSPAVGVGCCSLHAVECISRRSCPSLGLSEGRGAEIAIT